MTRNEPIALRGRRKSQEIGSEWHGRLAHVGSSTGETPVPLFDPLRARLVFSRALRPRVLMDAATAVLVAASIKTRLFSAARHTGFHA